MRPFIAVICTLLAGPALAECATDDTYFYCPTQGGTTPVRLCTTDPLNAELTIGGQTVAIDLASMRSTLPSDGPESYRAIDFHDPLSGQAFRVWATGLPVGFPEMNGGFEITEGKSVVDSARCDPDGPVMDRLTELFVLIDDAQVSP
ncbi:hypothetical protein [Donghicola mangrovi]|uniref:Secreted protein n=1 Tax=Donghicola mangrovi TaxID=2729614 RepID=A0A850Q9T8_9RHOB|nr:hypothetical protein [Donghicola mangrovi]NVO25703.1 hypothetical protein [Donghicola mangrovi]